VLAACDGNGGDGTAVTEMYPADEQISEDIPPRARQYLQQAIDSLNSPAGAIMLCASAVDAMLKAKNYKTGNLKPRIRQAAADHAITPGMEEWAHDIRLDANEQRHADENRAAGAPEEEEAPLPNEADAKQSIAFTKALAEFMFVLPAKVKRRGQP
jgi:hypothetical protein